MVRLIKKSGYIKAGSASGYMKYIAIRERVEKLDGSGRVTKGQQQFIEKLFRDFPDAKELPEYEDYSAVSTFGSASALISAVLDANAHKLTDRDGYMRYIATRLRAERHGEHGLFSKMIRSKLTNDIFQDEMYTLYQEKDISYKELVTSARRTMKELIEKVSSGSCGSPTIEMKMTDLAKSLEMVKGKKVYGYLKKQVKVQVDAIVDELAKLPEAAECYEVWNGLREELEGYYKDVLRQRLPLSQQKEFRVIKNLVIQEAENLRLDAFTFEDAELEDEPEVDSEVLPQGVGYGEALEYRQAAALLYDDDVTQAEKQEAVKTLKQLWDKGFTSAAYQLGRAYWNGLGVLPDDEKAEEWFRRSAVIGNAGVQYVLGKLLQEQGRLSEAVVWYERACESGSQYAQYSLGKMYLLGNVVPKDVSKAIQMLTSSANQGNQYAQYVLGKLCLQGKEVEENSEAAEYWLMLSAIQGNAPAQFLLDYRQHDPSVLLCTVRLIHHMSNIFWDTLPPPNPAGGHVESKLMGRIREKKIAMGYKPDDHEEYRGPSMSI